MIPGGALTGMFRKKAGGDPSFSSVGLLMHFDGSLADVKGKTVNVVAGSAAYATAPTGFGQEFDASGAATALSLSATSADFDFGTGDFTIEARVKLSSVSVTQVIVSVGGAGSYNYVFYISGVGLRWYAAGADRITGGSLTTGVTYSVAVSRVSGVTRLFVDGSQVGSSYTDSNNYTTAGTALQVIHQDNAARLVGSIDELRITKGVGRYAGAYTPAAAPFPDN